MAARLTKGLEIELYTGHDDARVVGLSDVIAKRLPGFVCEPDARNTEYITDPTDDMHALQLSLLKPRRALRTLLKELGGGTIIPGSTLPLTGDADKFIRSDAGNPYHTQIEQTYGTSVVTTSIHHNIGMHDVEQLMRACRLMRMESPLVLALTASSPFLNGQATGYHSTRWHTFPQTPRDVPLFVDHAHYVSWMDAQLALGTMWNVRHLWCSARPNGPNRPHELNRVEVRISDLTLDIPLTIAVALLLEHRMLLAIDGLDPLRGRYDADRLLAIATSNEQAVARNSLDAELFDWETGRSRRAREMVEDWLSAIRSSALTFDERATLTAVDRVLSDGNDAMRWLGKHQRGTSIQDIMIEAIAEVRDAEDALAQRLL